MTVATVCMDKVVFVSKIVTLQLSVGFHIGSGNNMRDYSSQSKVMDKYSQLYKDITSLVRNYQDLLKKDTATVSKMGTGIMDIDEWISTKLIKN